MARKSNRRIRKNLTLQPGTVEVGRRLARSQHRSFSNYVELLIARAAAQEQLQATEIRTAA